MGVCERCGTDLPPGARFCPACGTPVARGAAGEERKLVTVLFADVVGSTALGEHLDPEHLKALQQRLFAAMREEIEAEGGVVEKYAGDSVMAVFGAPVAHEDDAARAVRAASRLHGRVETLDAGGRAVRLRIGVNTGEAVAATDARPDIALVTGDVVNVAARLEQLADPGHTVVSDRTVKACPGLRTQPLGPVAVRGRDEPVAAAIVVGAPTVGRRGVPGLHAPIVGREAELALLRALYDRARTEGRPHLVTVYGEPGVGKSRLAREFTARLTDARVLRGRCLPYGEGITYWPLAEILKACAGVLDSDVAEVARARITALGTELLGPHRVPDPARSIAALMFTIGLDTGDERLRDADPRTVRADMQTAWRAFFSALADDGPTVVVVEDVHWAEPALLDLLDDVAERATGALLLLCPARPELTSTRPAWGAGRRSSGLALEPLSPADADRLVSLLLDIDDLPAATHRQILQRAEGNPFFLEEILRQLIDEGRIVRDGGRWRAAGDLRELRIPDTVQGVLAARIDLLDPPAKHVLQQAAVVGRGFWTGAIEALTGMGPDDVIESLDVLEERDLVLTRPSSSLAGERELAFTHILTRDVAYGTLTRRDRVEAHRRVVQWIDGKCCQGRRAELVELLAHHALAAYQAARDSGAADDEIQGLRHDAFSTSLEAAHDAAQRYALAKAQRLARDAIAVAGNDLERADAEEALGDAYYPDFGMGDEAWEHYTRAAELRMADSGSEPTAIARACARAVELRTRFPASMRRLPTEEEAAPYLAAGLEHAGTGDSEERLRLLVGAAFWVNAFRRSAATDVEMKEASATGEEALAMAERLHRSDLASAALDAMAIFSIGRGHYGDADELIERRLQLVPELAVDSEIGDIHAMAAWQRYSVGRYADAKTVARDGARLSAEAPAWAVHCVVWQAKAAFRLGEFDEVVVHRAFADALFGEAARRPPPFAAPLYAVAACVSAIRGDEVERTSLLARVVDDREAVPRRSLLEGWLARAALYAGDLEHARWHLSRDDIELGLEGLGDMLDARGELALATRDWAHAPEVAAAMRALASECALLALAFSADRLDGAAALASGDEQGGRELLRRAADGFSSLDARWDEAWSRLLLGGDDRERALAFLDSVGCVPPVRERLDALG